MKNSKKLTDFQKKLKLVTDRFHNLQVDHTEFTCLKTLTLFKSGKWISPMFRIRLLKINISNPVNKNLRTTCILAFISDAHNLHDKLHVQILQDQTQLMLQNYSAIRQNLRFGKLLLLLKSVGSFESRTTEEIFFEKYPTDGNASILNSIFDLLRQ